MPEPEDKLGSLIERFEADVRQRPLPANEAASAQPPADAPAAPAQGSPMSAAVVAELRAELADVSAASAAPAVRSAAPPAPQGRAPASGADGPGRLVVKRKAARGLAATGSSPGSWVRAPGSPRSTAFPPPHGTGSRCRASCTTGTRSWPSTSSASATPTSRLATTGAPSSRPTSSRRCGVTSASPRPACWPTTWA